MAVNAPRAWLVAYDIADERRLSRLHRFLKKHAVPVQYSVFYFEGSSVQLCRLLDDIAKRIDPQEDDVRAYPMPDDPQYYTLGRGSLPLSGALYSGRNEALGGLTLPAGGAMMEPR